MLAWKRYCLLPMTMAGTLVACSPTPDYKSDAALLAEMEKDEQVMIQALEVEQANKASRDPEKSPYYTTIYDAFSTHDTNADGYIDDHEFVQFQTDPEIVRIRKSIPELDSEGPLLFVEIDENEDGLINIREMTTITQPLMTRPH